MALLAETPDKALLKTIARPTTSASLQKANRTLSTAELERPSNDSELADDEVKIIQQLVNELELYGVPKGLRKPCGNQKQMTHSVGGELRLNRQRINQIGEFQATLAGLQSQLIIAMNQLNEIHRLNWMCANYSAAMVEHAKLVEEFRREEEDLQAKQRDFAERKKRRLSTLRW